MRRKLRCCLGRTLGCRSWSKRADSVPFLQGDAPEDESSAGQPDEEEGEGQPNSPDAVREQDLERAVAGQERLGQTTRWSQLRGDPRLAMEVLASMLHEHEHVCPRATYCEERPDGVVGKQGNQEHQGQSCHSE